jgi:hypothetical protein
VAEAKTSSKKDLTRGKAILIGILSVVLVVILYIQFGGSEAKPTGAGTAYRPPRPAVAVQSVNSSSSPVTLASATTPAPSVNKDKNVVATQLIDGARWKSPKLSTVVAYDPFALPSSFPQPKVSMDPRAKGSDGLIAAATAGDAKKLAEAVEKRYMQLEELKQRGVHVITRDEGGQFVAWIGERKLHVGDTINGFTVTAIDPDDGVWVERKESP